MMNIPGFTTRTLIEWHNLIRECMRKDDENCSPEKVYRVREFRDWREHADAFEKELKNRKVDFTPIQW